MASKGVSPVIARRAVPAIEDTASLHELPFVARLFASRGATTSASVSTSLRDLPSPALLPDIDKAVQRLATALTQRERILVVGDYDCDGATSTALCVSVLQAWGATDIHYLVPNRFEYGYGLSPAIVELALSRYGNTVITPDAQHTATAGTEKPVASAINLLITVDNGVASVEGVQRATEAGIDVVVTDHHLPPETLPQACAIVNPNLVGAEFESPHLAGVGVIFYVLLALRAELKSIGWFEQTGTQPSALIDCLDLVAIGTVADVVPLDRTNRILVEQGLRRIRAGSTRPGVNALLAVAGREATAIAATDIGFAIGPRLNAAGRLEDMSVGIDCLLATGEADARRLATELDQLNQSRRSIEQEMRDEAELLLAEAMTVADSASANSGSRGDASGRKASSGSESGHTIELLATESDVTPNDIAVCLFEPHWHQGVTGILAGRLKESLNVPVIVFAATDDQSLKGSGRSIPELHLRDAIARVAVENPGLVGHFGGHAMAAGLNLDADGFAEFKTAFGAVVYDMLGGRIPGKVWETDGHLDPADHTLDNAQLLRFVAPWGQGFPEPLFDGLFRIQQCRVLKERHLKLSVSPPDDTAAVCFDAIAFNQTPPVDVGDVVRLVYRLNVNEFRGQQSVQLMVASLMTAECGERSVQLN